MAQHEYPFENSLLHSPLQNDYRKMRGISNTRQRGARQLHSIPVCDFLLKIENTSTVAFLPATIYDLTGRLVSSHGPTGPADGRSLAPEVGVLVGPSEKVGRVP